METKTYTFQMPQLPAWTMAAAIGYEPKTTFWQDFCIAERFGADAIKDTFKRAFAEWKQLPVYLTEMALVLNHRGWVWYHVADKLRNSDSEQERNKADIATWIKEIYFGYYDEVVAWARDNYSGNDLEYFNKTID